MAMLNAMKVKCIKCGYGIPLASQGAVKEESLQCPKCNSDWTILRDEGEVFLEPKRKE